MAVKIRLGNKGFALVDDEDADRVRTRVWQLQLGYAKSNNQSRKYKEHPGAWISMHKFILGINGRRPCVDHINGDRLDNRKCNLRIATDSQNQANERRVAVGKTSKFKGVSFNHSRGKWRATIMVNRKQIYVGRFRTEVEAALAYDRAAKKYFGEFAATNADLGLYHAEKSRAS